MIHMPHTARIFRVHGLNARLSSRSGGRDRRSLVRERATSTIDLARAWDSFSRAHPLISCSQQSSLDASEENPFIVVVISTRRPSLVAYSAGGLKCRGAQSYPAPAGRVRRRGESVVMTPTTTRPPKHFLPLKSVSRFLLGVCQQAFNRRRAPASTTAALRPGPPTTAR